MLKKKWKEPVIEEVKNCPGCKGCTCEEEKKKTGKCEYERNCGSKDIPRE